MSLAHLHLKVSSLFYPNPEEDCPEDRPSYYAPTNFFRTLPSWHKPACATGTFKAAARQMTFLWVSLQEDNEDSMFTCRAATVSDI